jgi:predicted transcriptional regulator
MDLRVKTITDADATDYVNILKRKHGIDNLAKALDMSKMTIYVRLKSNEWSYKEKILIERIWR